MTITCAKCGIEQPEDAFQRQAGRKTGRHSWCKTCTAAHKKRMRERHDTPERRRNENMWTRYRLRPDDVVAILVKQGGVCAICAESPERAVVDHCHETGAVRGILCHRCNVRLPAIEESAYVAGALRYLNRDVIEAQGEA